MKSLYDSGERLTSEGIALDNEAIDLLSSLVDKYSKKGYSIREISHTIFGSLGMVQQCAVGTKSSKRSKTTTTT